MTEVAGDKSGKSPDAYRTIGEVSDMLGVAQHVLRFWESRFAQIKPVKRAGNRRYYRPDDIALIRRIRELLHDEGYSIRGVQKLLKASGVKGVVDGGVVDGADAPTSAPAAVPASTPTAALASAPAGNREALRDVLGELKEIRELLR
jgi:DNA-binding transcriptional MerR regulator